jgi:FixJ family two-component response regulator
MECQFIHRYFSKEQSTEIKERLRLLSPRRIDALDRIVVERINK